MDITIQELKDLAKEMKDLKSNSNNPYAIREAMVGISQCHWLLVNFIHNKEMEAKEQNKGSKKSKKH